MIMPKPRRPWPSVNLETPIPSRLVKVHVLQFKDTVFDAMGFKPVLPLRPMSTDPARGEEANEGARDPYGDSDLDRDGDANSSGPSKKGTPEQE